MRLSLIVPCYNEQDNVVPFFERVREVFAPEMPEIVFVDDGSSDETLSRLKGLYSVNDGIRVLSFTRNFGKEAAMLAGLRAASGDYIGIIDADLQQDPSVAKEMLDILLKDDSLEMVAACQNARREGAAHKLCKKCFYSLSRRICSIPFEPNASDFRVMRRRVADAVLSDPESNRFSKGIFAWTGFSTRFYSYTVMDRNSGKSKWSIRSLTGYALNGIFSFSEKPLSFSLVVSCITSFAAVLSLILLLVFDADPVLTVLLPVTLLLFSLVFFVLWIIGKYVNMALSEAKRRPAYVLREDLNRKDS